VRARRDEALDRIAEGLTREGVRAA
jgi:hypothetical protein